MLTTYLLTTEELEREASPRVCKLIEENLAGYDEWRQGRSDRQIIKYLRIAAAALNTIITNWNVTAESIYRGAADTQSFEHYTATGYLIDLPDAPQQAMHDYIEATQRTLHHIAASLKAAPRRKAAAASAR